MEVMVMGLSRINKLPVTRRTPNYDGGWWWKVMTCMGRAAAK